MPVHGVVVVIALHHGDGVVGEHVLAAVGVGALVVEEVLPLGLVGGRVGDVAGQVDEVQAL